MKNKRSWFRSPVVTALVFAAAIGLLFFSGIGMARAIPSIRTDNEYTNIAHESIGVTLRENGSPVSNGTLLGTMLEQTNGKLILNQTYSEPLDVANTGEINEYVRVTLRKYWVDSDGKQTDLSPELIHVTLGEQDLYADSFTGANGWLKDSAATTEERVVLYYNQVVPAGTGVTGLFADSIRIDNAIATAVESHTETNAAGTTITNVYKYDGVQFCLEATVDAVQEHNAQYVDSRGNSVGAIPSAWGRNVTVNGTSLTLN